MITKIGREITSLYFAEDCVDSWYDHTNNVIITTWFNFSTDMHYREAYLVQLEAAKKHRPRAIIIDTSNAFGIPYPEDQKWLLTTIFPEAKKLNLEFIINIFPVNLITKTAVKTVINFGKSNNFDIIEMPTFEEAYDFIKSH